MGNKTNVNTWLAMAMFLLAVPMPSLAAANVSMTVTSLSPEIGVQTEPVQFMVGLQNDGEAVTLNTQTSLEFTDGSLTYTTTLAAETTIGSGASAILLFAMESIASGFASGSYVPTLTCQGLAGGEIFTEVLTLTENPVEIKPNLSQLSEVSDPIWPSTPTNADEYPYLIRLSNDGGTEITLDQRTRIAITDGTRLYANASLALDANMAPGQVTKLEFAVASFPDVPAGPYQAVITLIGPAYSQTLALSQNLIEVVPPPGGRSIGGGPSTTDYILVHNEQVTTQVVISSSSNFDQLFRFMIEPEGGTIPYPDAAVVGEYSAPAFCDIDNDGDLDFFAGGSWGDITSVENSGTPAEPSWGSDVPGYELMRVGYRSKPAFADIDADGDVDLFIGDAVGNLWFYRNLGTSTEPNWISSPRQYPDLNIGLEASPTFVDIDADGDFDLLTGCVDGTLWYLQNIGSPNVPDWTDGIMYAGVDVGEYSVPAFADIDNDGDYDLFIGCSDGTIAFIENIGTAAEPQWGAVIANYSGIDVGDNASPGFADIDADGDFDLFIGRQSSEGVLFYRNTGSISAPSWTTEAFSPTYIKPPQFPETLTWDPTTEALITDPNISFMGPAKSRAYFYVTFAATGNELMATKYEFPIYAKTVRLGSGGGIGVGVKLKYAVTFDDDCEAIISGISTQSSQFHRAQSFEVEVRVTNPKPYWLPLDLSAWASTLTFWRDQEDVSDKFFVDLIAGADRISPGAEETLTFSVIPSGDAPLGEITIDPVVTTTMSSLQAVNWGSTEWPIPSVLTINILPSHVICTDTPVVAVQEGGTRAFGVKLLDQPPGDLVVSVGFVESHLGISIESGSSLLFTAENWDAYQPVTIAALPDADANHDTAQLRCSADGYVSKDVTAIQYEEPSDFYVNDEIEEDGFGPGDDSHCGVTPLAPMRSIQGLLERYPTIGTGSTVYVSAGTYVENIVIGAGYSGLGLLGAGAEKTTIDGNWTGPCISLDGFSSGLISGFAIRGGDGEYAGGSDAGGIQCVSSSPIITNNRIVENHGKFGGGILCQDCSPQIINNVIRGNVSSSSGGGITCSYAHPTIANNIIAGNSGQYTSGIYLYYSNPTIANNTMTSNQRGNTIRCKPGNPIIANNIIAFNYEGIYGSSGSSPVLVCNCVYGNAGGDYDGSASPGLGDISVDPNFVNREIGDYHLSPNSPCIDAGDNNSVPEDSTDLDNDGDTSEFIPYDLDGLPRITDGDCNSTEIVDMGAYELLRSDIDSSGSVDMVDFSRFALYWRDTGCGVCGGTDLTCDGNVDSGDLAQLAKYWLAGVEP